MMDTVKDQAQKNLATYQANREKYGITNEKRKLMRQEGTLGRINKKNKFWDWIW